MKTKNQLTTSLFDSFFNELFDESKSLVTYYSDIKFSTEEDVYNINIPIPGLTKEDIKIKFKDGQLIISYAMDKEKNKYEFVKDFYRRYYLPKDVDYDKIKASVENGVCTIQIPKDKEKINERLIQIN